MKKMLFGLICLASLEMHAFEYEKQFENKEILVSKVKILPYEEIDLHRDAYPQVVIALQGGTMTRLEADGRAIDINFPTGVAVFREADPINEVHRSVNYSSEPVELITILLKNNEPVLPRENIQSHDIAVDIRINCPTSEELSDFVKSIPLPGHYSTTFEEWKSSFVNNMTKLIRLVESEKVFNSWWSVRNEEHVPQEINKD
ncbi:MAG: hypothetical protein V4494_03060 [Chlamydiota bacterium]